MRRRARSRPASSSAIASILVPPRSTPIRIIASRCGRDVGPRGASAPRAFALRRAGPARAVAREVEPFLADLRIGVREDDDAVERRDDRRAVAARADALAGADAVEAPPGLDEDVAVARPVDDLAQTQRLDALRRRRIGGVDQAEMRQRVYDRGVADVERERVLVLAALERDGGAADRAHVLGRADAVGRIEVE